MPDDGGMPHVCPYVGLLGVPATFSTSPTEGHRCYKRAAPVAVATAHQSSFCLTPYFEQCPVFRGAEIVRRTHNPVDQRETRDELSRDSGRGDAGQPPLSPGVASATSSRAIPGRW